jgi:hypothetical protein
MFERAEKKQVPPVSHCEHNWAMYGVAAGHKLWSQFCGLCKSDRYDDVECLMDWKNTREVLEKVSRPDYTAQRWEDVLQEVYNQFPDGSDEYSSRLSSARTITPASSGSTRGVPIVSDVKIIHKTVVGFKGTHSGLVDVQVLRENSTDDIPPWGNDDDDGEEEVEVGDDEYVSDYRLNNSEIEYKKVSAKRHSSMNRSLGAEMESRKTLAFPLL